MPDWDAAQNHFTFAPSAPPPVREPEPTPPPAAAPAAAPAWTGAASPQTDPNIGPYGLYVGAPSREFVEAAKVCLSKYATFRGRASRSEFWFFYLFYMLVAFVAQIIDVALIFAVFATGVPFFLPIFTTIVTLGMFLPQLAVSWRRLHDIDRTGWWLGDAFLVGAIFYGVIIALVIGTAPTGDFGSEPPAALLVAAPIFVLLGFAWGITIFIFYLTKGTLGPNRFG